MPFPKEILQDPRFHLDTNAEKNLLEKPIGTYLFRQSSEDNCITLCFSVLVKVLDDSNKQISSYKKIKRIKYKVTAQEADKFEIIALNTDHTESTRHPNLDHIIQNFAKANAELKKPLLIEELFPINKMSLSKEILNHPAYHPDTNAEECLKNINQGYIFRKCRIDGYLVVINKELGRLTYHYFKLGKANLFYEMKLENLNSDCDCLITLIGIDEIIEEYKLINQQHFISTYSDPFEFVVPSTQVTVPTEIIYHILSFLTVSDLMRACASKLLLNHIISFMQAALNRNYDRTIDTTNPMKLNDANTRLYFFTHKRNQEFISVNLTERKLKTVETLHKQLMLALEKACTIGDPNEVKYLLKKATDLNIQLKWSQSVENFPPLNQQASTKALHIAAAKGHIECIKLLINKGAPPNIFGSIDNEPKILVTPLSLANKNRYPQAVFSLLTLGARASNPVFIQRKGYTAPLQPFVQNSSNADEISQIKNFMTVKIHIENAEEKLIASCKDGIIESNCREYIKTEFIASYSCFPKLFINIFLNILGKEKIMHHDDYFDLRGQQRKVSPDAIQFFIEEFVAVLNILGIPDPELQLTLAVWHLEQEDHQQAFKCYATAKQLFKKQPPQILTLEEIEKINQKMDAAIEQINNEIKDQPSSCTLS